MTIAEKTKKALAVIEQHQLKSVIAVTVSSTSLYVHLFDAQEMKDLPNVKTEEHDNETYPIEMFSEVDGVRVFTLLGRSEAVGA